MKKRTQNAKDRSQAVTSTRTNLSTAEQIARGESEGMVVVAEDLSGPRHPLPLAETTSLERRVLAHERILQSLIAHMAETNPEFLQRLQERFGLPMKYREQDYIETEDFAEEFVRAIEEAVHRRRVKTASNARAEEKLGVIPETPNVAIIETRSDFS